MKRTVIVGATPNSARYAYTAAELLMDYDHDIVPIGIRKGLIEDKEIQDIRQKPIISDVDTITLYIGPHRQQEWYEYLLSLKPRRIIFNPGTENSEFEKLAQANGVEVIKGCTLVMLSTHQY